MFPTSHDGVSFCIKQAGEKPLGHTAFPLEQDITGEAPDELDDTHTAGTQLKAYKESQHTVGSPNGKHKRIGLVSGHEIFKLSGHEGISPEQKGPMNEPLEEVDETSGVQLAAVQFPLLLPPNILSQHSGFPVSLQIAKGVSGEHSISNPDRHCTLPS